jgi:hypothetical protein
MASLPAEGVQNVTYEEALECDEPVTDREIARQLWLHGYDMTPDEARADAAMYDMRLETIGDLVAWLGY